LAYVAALLVIDFFVLNRKVETITPKKALLESIFFIINALIFGGILFWLFKNDLTSNPNNLSPNESLVKYITGYLIELSLSIDNLFVIAIIFTEYKIPMKYQHKLLFLGIVGAIFFRAILIGLGLVLMSKVHSLSIVFGLFLLYTAFKMLKKEEIGEPNKTSGISKYLNISKHLDGGKFRTSINGKRVFTGLFGALVTIEFTDLLFALDSIPAIFAVTTDPYIVFSSNIFAIMGLRSLYFFLANMLEKFKYLKYSIFTILIYVSLKLIVANWISFPEWFSLLFIAISLAFGIRISIIKMKVNNS